MTRNIRFFMFFIIIIICFFFFVTSPRREGGVCRLALGIGFIIMILYLCVRKRLQFWASNSDTNWCKLCIFWIWKLVEQWKTALKKYHTWIPFSVFGLNYTYMPNTIHHPSDTIYRDELYSPTTENKIDMQPTAILILSWGHIPVIQQRRIQFRQQIFTHSGMDTTQ